MNERVYEELALNGLQLQLIGLTMKNKNTKNQIQSNSVKHSNTIHLSSADMYCKSDWVPESESISAWSEPSLASSPPVPLLASAGHKIKGESHLLCSCVQILLTI